MTARPDADADRASAGTTNLGPVMDATVARARARLRPGGNPDYDLIHAHFDVLHYLLQTPQLADDPDVDLIEHYLTHGRANGLSPHPDFSMTEYLSRYPVRTAPDRVRDPFLYWLRHGRARGDIAEPTPGMLKMAPLYGLTPAELAEQAGARRRDLQQRLRTGTLGRLLARAAEVEPLIAETWTELANPHLVPLTRLPVTNEILALHAVHSAAGFRRARVIVVTGRADGTTDRIVRALSADIGADEIVVLATDGNPDAVSGGIPDGLRAIDFADIVRGLPGEDAQHVLAVVLRTFRADAVVIGNSTLMYQVLRGYGTALAASERIFICFSEAVRTGMGNATGRYFYRLFDTVTGVLIDSAALAADLMHTYRVGDKDQHRIHVLDGTADAGLPFVTQFPPRAEREAADRPAVHQPAVARDRPVAPTVDLTLVVTAHDETVVAGPTMTSADIAVADARAAGYTIQTVIALDKATEATSEYFHQPCFDHWERWVMDSGDLGRVRNALAPRTSGRFIAFLDADDLFSANWLSAGLAVLTAADDRGERVIAHPEVNIHFDGSRYLLHNTAQDSPLFTPYFLYVRNGYDALCMARREAYLDVPYLDNDLRAGLAYEDWQFAVETMARGWKHVVVPDTIIFKRRRDGSLLGESRARRALIRSLPEMAIDRIREIAR